MEIKKCWIHEDGLERVHMDIMRVLDAQGFEPYDDHAKSAIRTILVRGFKGKCLYF